MKANVIDGEIRLTFSEYEAELLKDFIERALPLVEGCYEEPGDREQTAFAGQVLVKVENALERL